MGQRAEFSPRTGAPIPLPPGAKAYDDNDNEVPLSNVVQGDNGTVVKPAGPRKIKFEGNLITVPNDATDDEIKQVLSKYTNEGLSGTARPNPSTFDGGLDSPNDTSLDEKLYKRLYEDPATNAVNAVKGGKYKKAVNEGSKAASVFTLPFAASSMITNPVGTTAAVGAGALGMKAGSSIAKHFGADQDAQDLVGTATGIASGAAGAWGSGSVVRGAGRALSSVEAIPDFPVNTGSRIANFATRSVNALKRPISSGVAAAGKGMSNYGIPSITDAVYPGEVPKPFQGTFNGKEPELPTPVSADGQSHYNDVPGLPEGLKTPVSRPDPLWKTAGTTPTIPDIPTFPAGRNAFARRNPTGISDTMDAQSRGAGFKPTPGNSPIRIHPDRQNIMRDEPLSPSNAQLPDPATEQLKMELSKVPPSPPTNGLDTSEPWDKILGDDELGHALDTDPYNQSLEQLQPFRRRRNDLQSVSGGSDDNPPIQGPPEGKSVMDVINELRRSDPRFKDVHQDVIMRHMLEMDGVHPQMKAKIREYFDSGGTSE